MATTRDGAAWTVLVERLANEPLAALAAEVEISVSELERRLTLADPGGSALRAPWWPEAARRVMGGASLRATACCFGTNPRRLRRGLPGRGCGSVVWTFARRGFQPWSPTRPCWGQCPMVRWPHRRVCRRRRCRGSVVGWASRPSSPSVPSPTRRCRSRAPARRRPDREAAPAGAGGRRPGRAEASAPQVIRRASPARMGRAGARTPAPAPDAVPLKAAVPTLNKGGPVLAPRSPETASGGERRRRRLVRPDRPDEPEGATGGSRPAASAASARHGAVRVVLAKEPTLELRAAAPRPQPLAEARRPTPGPRLGRGPPNRRRRPGECGRPRLEAPQPPTRVETVAPRRVDPRRMGSRSPLRNPCPRAPRRPGGSRSMVRSSPSSSSPPTSPGPSPSWRVACPRPRCAG